MHRVKDRTELESDSSVSKAHCPAAERLRLHCALSPGEPDLRLNTEQPVCGEVLPGLDSADHKRLHKGPETWAEGGLDIKGHRWESGGTWRNEEFAGARKNKAADVRVALVIS